MNLAEWWLAGGEIVEALVLVGLTVAVVILWRLVLIELGRDRRPPRVNKRDGRRADE